MQTMKIHSRNLLTLGLFAAACSASDVEPVRGTPDAPSSETVDSQATPESGAKLRQLGKIVPQAIKPAVTPAAFDTRLVRVMVELEDQPITVAQAALGGRRFTATERNELRATLQSKQSDVARKVEALGGRVIRSYQNAYNGVSVWVPRNQIAALRQVSGVAGVHYITLKRPDNANAVPLVGAPALWDGVAGLHGEGTKIAIVDTGIDYTHANFGGPGTVEAYEAAHAVEAGEADASLFGPDAPRIKGGIDLVGDAYDPGSADPDRHVPHPDDNPLDCNGHGSHVAGTAAGSGVTLAGTTFAGPYNGSTFHSTFGIAPGVAPKADLYAVRVFGCEGATDQVVDAIEWAVDHDMDVINMSLGSSFGGPDDPDAVAAANAMESGVIVIASAGNSGPNPYITGSPASGRGVVSVAATDPAAGFAGVELNLGTETITGINANGATFASGTSYPIVVLGSPDSVGLGCTAEEYGPEVAGALVVTQRGTCARVDRAIHGQAAGAAAVVMINNASGLPPFEGVIEGVTIPFFGVSADDGAALAHAASAAATGVLIPNPSFKAVASFSSSGPRYFDSQLKPTLAAPGVAIHSTLVGGGNKGAVMSGTSMAAPVVSGLAALARQAHASWSAQDVAFALSNTSNPADVANYVTRRAGAGLPSAVAAAKTEAVAYSGEEAAVNFGFIEARSPQKITRTLRVMNRSNRTMQFNVQVPETFVQGVAHSVKLSKTAVRISRRSSTSIKVTLDVKVPTDVEATAFLDLAGVIELKPADPTTNGAVSLRVPYYGVIRPEARLNAVADIVPSTKRPNGRLDLTNAGAAIAGTADVYAWGIDGRDDNIGCNDLRAVGVQSLPYSETDKLLVFAVETWRRCSNHAINEYDVIIQNEVGDLYGVIGIDRGYITTGSFSGEIATYVLNLQTNAASLLPAVAATDSTTVQLVALSSQLGLSAEKPRFSYFATSYSGREDSPDAPEGVATFNAYASSVIGQGAFETIAPNTRKRVAIGIEPTEFAVTPALGAMVVLAENGPGPSQAALIPFNK
jgi:subtilisin family serine protease